MSLAFMRSEHPIVAGKRDPVDREWLRWLRDVWSSLGFDAKAPIYDELSVAGSALNLDGSSASMGSFVGGVRLPSFPDALSSPGYFGVRLPNAYRNGTDLSPFVEWAPSTAAAGDVVWELEIAAGIDGAAVAISTSKTASGAASGIGRVRRSLFSGMDGSGLDRGSIMCCRLSRLGADAADTYAAAASVVAVGIKYEREAIGTTEANP